MPRPGVRAEVGARRDVPGKPAILSVATAQPPSTEPRAGSDQSRDREGALACRFDTVLVKECAKHVVSEVRSRIGGSLADARGSDQSRDREGALACRFDTVLVKECTKLASGPLQACGRSLTRRGSVPGFLNPKSKRL